MEQRFPAFTERFTQLRGDMTQAAFAEFLGMSRPTVGFYESGSRIPDALGVKAIAEKCHVSADWLLGLSDVRSTDGDMQQACNYTGLTERAVKQLSHSLHPDRYDQLFLEQLPSFVSCMVEDGSLPIAIAFLSSAIEDTKAIQAPAAPNLDFSGFDALTDQLHAQGYSAIPINQARNVYIELAINDFRKIVTRFVSEQSSSRCTKEATDHAQKE